MTVMNLTNKYNCCTKRINQNICLNLIHDDLHTKQQYTVMPMIPNETTEWPVSMARIQFELTKPTAMTVTNLNNKYSCCTKWINQNIPLNLIHDDLHTKQHYTVLPMILNKTTEWPVSMARIQSESTKPTAMTVTNLTNKYNYCTKWINQNIPLNLIHNDCHESE